MGKKQQNVSVCDPSVWVTEKGKYYFSGYVIFSDHVNYIYVNSLFLILG